MKALWTINLCFPNEHGDDHMYTCNGTKTGLTRITFFIYVYSNYLFQGNRHRYRTTKQSEAACKIAAKEVVEKQAQKYTMNFH